MRRVAHSVDVVESAEAALYALQPGSYDILVAGLPTSVNVGTEIPIAPCNAESQLTECRAVLLIKLADVLVQPVLIDQIVSAVNTLAEPTERITDHAGRRWARAVAGPILATDDPRTLTEWAASIGSSVGTVRNWCRTAGISARRSLIFARLLRAAVLHERTDVDAERLLNVADLRTLRKMLLVADPNVRHPKLAEKVSVFLASQQLVTDASVIREVETELRRRLSTERVGSSSSQAAARNRQG